MLAEYIGLKDFIRGCKELYKEYGNIPVFVNVEGKLAPFGMAITMGELLQGEAIVLYGGTSKPANQFEKGRVTE